MGKESDVGVRSASRRMVISACESAEGVPAFDSRTCDAIIWTRSRRAANSSALVLIPASMTVDEPSIPRAVFC